MKTTRTFLVAGALSAIALSASAVSAQSPQTITDLSGSVRIQQEAPCGDPVDVTESIERGLMEISPLATADGVRFDLIRLEMFLTPFSVERNCFGIPVTAEYHEIGIRLAGAVRFTGEETSGLGSQLYRFRIPKDQFLVFESILDNNPVPQPETTYQRPSEDVTGLIELVARRSEPTIDAAPLLVRSVQMHIVLTSELRFRGGCVNGHCLINEKDDGTQTSDIVAEVIPGLQPPTVSCSPVRPLGNSFRVLAQDDTDPSPTIKLGTFTLANGETFQLQQTGQPGVRLLDATHSGDTRHFQVGPGEGFVIATDSDGLSAIAYCIK